MLYGATAPGRAGQRQLQRRRLSGRRLVCPGALPWWSLAVALLAAAPHRGRHRLCQTDQGGHMELVIRNLTKQYPQQTGGGRGEPHPPPGGVRPAGGANRGGENRPHADALRHPPPPPGGDHPGQPHRGPGRTTGPAWATCPRTLATTPASPGWTFSSTWGPKGPAPTPGQGPGGGAAGPGGPVGGSQAGSKPTPAG